MKITERGLDEVIASFDKAGAEMPKEAADKVSDALKNIRTNWRAAWQGRFDHAPRVHESITYEVTARGMFPRGVVGPVDEPVRQGFLGRILEFGAEHSGPHPGGIPASEVEEPRFEAAVDEMMRRLIPS